jgi:hypothetical protein
MHFNTVQEPIVLHRAFLCHKSKFWSTVLAFFSPVLVICRNYQQDLFI